MLKRDKNRLIELIEANGLVRHTFSGEDTVSGSGPQFTLTHRPTKLIFSVSCAPDNFDRFECEYSSFDPQRTMMSNREAPGTLSFYDYSDWDKIAAIFGHWIRMHVKRATEELELPDLWAGVMSPPAESAVELPNDNSPFLPYERLRLAEGLASLHATVAAAHDLTDSGVAGLKVQVDYLISASERLGRKDWTALAYGALLSFALQEAMAGETARLLFGLLTATVSTALGSSQLLP